MTRKNPNEKAVPCGQVQAHGEISRTAGYENVDAANDRRPFRSGIRGRDRRLRLCPELPAGRRPPPVWPSLLPTQNGWPPALPMTRDNELPEQTEPEEKTGCGCCRHSKSPDLRLANERTRPPHPHVLNSTFGAAEQRAYDMCDKLTHPRELG